MIKPEEIAKWAELYDLGYRNLDLSSEEASAARRELYRLVRERTPLFFRTAAFPLINSTARQSAR